MKKIFEILKESDIYLDLWVQIINRKVSNQARALSIMGMNGAENISKYLESITAENVDITEALAAKEYFSYYHEGLNRRIDDPIEYSCAAEPPVRCGESHQSGL